MKAKEIIILVNTGNSSGRDLLRGILRFSTSAQHWRLRICDFADNGAQRFFDFYSHEHIDGIITSELENGGIAKALETSPIPLVVIGTRKSALPTRTEKLVVVTLDEMSVGALGAQTLQKLGAFNAFAFVNMRNDTYRYLSLLRNQGFASQLQKAGVTPQSYDTEIPESESDEMTLCEWIRALPKPAAVLAASDARAVDVLRATIQTGFRVPEDVSILGIDDDEFKCLSTTPTLSSIHLDAEGQGFEAARQLDIMLRRRQPHKGRTRHFAGKLNVVHRWSTRTLAPGKALVSRIREFISQNADRPLTIREIVAFSHVSQRLLFLRFKEFSDKSIQETINAERIKYFCKRLRTGNGTIQDVATRCGFNNMATLRSLFTSITGMTIREWRRQAKEALAKPSSWCGETHRCSHFASRSSLRSADMHLRRGGVLASPGGRGFASASKDS